MDPNEVFEEAFDETADIEGLGKLSNNPKDPGKQTFTGISRVYWPSWAGWGIIDTAPRPLHPHIIQELLQLAKTFCRINFWDRMQGNALAQISPAIAKEMFDTAFNLDVPDAVRFLQAGYNVARGEYGADLEVDGKLGPNTLQAIKNYMISQPGTPKQNEEIILNCMNGEQYIYYRSNPRRKYFRGWFRRV